MSKLEERENKRKRSVVQAMVANEPQEAESCLPADRSKSSESSSGIVIQVKPKPTTRSKRVNLLLTPAIYEAAQKKCVEIGISFNECVNQLLEQWA